MPPLGREHVRAAVAELRHLGLGLPHCPLLDRAALGVDGVELGGDLRSPLRIGGQQQLEAGVGAASACRRR